MLLLYIHTNKTSLTNLRHQHLVNAGTEKEALIKGKSTQNKILEYVKDNPGVRQVDIVRALKLLETNVSRDMRKLLQDEYIIIDDKKRYHATP